MPNRVAARMSGKLGRASERRVTTGLCAQHSTAQISVTQHSAAQHSAQRSSACSPCVEVQGQHVCERRQQQDDNDCRRDAPLSASQHPQQRNAPHARAVQVELPAREGGGRLGELHQGQLGGEWNGLTQMRCAV